MWQQEQDLRGVIQCYTGARVSATSAFITFKSAAKLLWLRAAGEGGQRGRMPPQRRPAASVLRRPAAAPYPAADPTRAIGAALIAAAEAAAPPGAALFY